MSAPVEYYKSLITSEYQQSSNMLDFLEACLNVLADVNDCIDGMFYEFDLDNAVGAQLDVIGLVVGVNRKVNFQPTNAGDSPVLNDATYRLVLKARIAMNSWDGRLTSLYPIWNELFPGGTIIIHDYQNMTFQVTLAGKFSQLIIDLINNGYIVPRPEGVLMTNGIANLPMLGFDENDTYIAGFDVGKWS